MPAMTQEQVNELYKGIYGPAAADPFASSPFANGFTSPQLVDDFYRGIYGAPAAAPTRSPTTRTVQTVSVDPVTGQPTNSALKAIDRLAPSPSGLPALYGEGSPFLPRPSVPTGGGSGQPGIGLLYDPVGSAFGYSDLSSLFLPDVSPQGGADDQVIIGAGAPQPNSFTNGLIARSFNAVNDAPRPSFIPTPQNPVPTALPPITAPAPLAPTPATMSPALAARRAGGIAAPAPAPAPARPSAGPSSGSSSGGGGGSRSSGGASGLATLYTAGDYVYQPNAGGGYTKVGKLVPSLRPSRSSGGSRGGGLSTYNGGFDADTVSSWGNLG